MSEEKKQKIKEYQKQRYQKVKESKNNDILTIQTNCQRQKPNNVLIMLKVSEMTNLIMTCSKSAK